MIKIARSEFKSYTNVRTLLSDKDHTCKSIFIHAHTHTHTGCHGYHQFLVMDKNEFESSVYTCTTGYHGYYSDT